TDLFAQVLDGYGIPVSRERVTPFARTRLGTGLLAFADADAALDALVTLRRRLPGSLETVELFLAAGVRLVCDHLGLTPPFGRLDPVYLLVEVAGAHDPTEELAEAGETEVLDCEAWLSEVHPTATRVEVERTPLPVRAFEGAEAA
ncbi:MAG: hypothetical protein ABR562_03775, partial [Thermoplasmatota archaeon]